jgi:hypothetical protein
MSETVIVNLKWLCALWFGFGVFFRDLDFFCDIGIYKGIRQNMIDIPLKGEK